jgi:hypothetical protein
LSHTPPTQPPPHPPHSEGPAGTRFAMHTKHTHKTSDTPQRNQHTPANQTRAHQQTKQTARTTRTNSSSSNSSNNQNKHNRQPPPHPTPGHTTARGTGTARSCQMLASTIQISNNNPTPTTPTPSPRRGRQAGQLTIRPRLTPRSDHQPALKHHGPSPTPGATPTGPAPVWGMGLIPQNPNSVLIDLATPRYNHPPQAHRSPRGRVKA